MWKSWRTLRGGDVCIQVSVTGKTRNIAHLGEDREFLQDRQRNGRGGSSSGWTTVNKG